MKHRVQDAFDKIHAEQDLKDHTLKFLEYTTNRYMERKIISSTWLIMSAACFVLLLSAEMGYSALNRDSQPQFGAKQRKG